MSLTGKGPYTPSKGLESVPEEDRSFDGVTSIIHSQEKIGRELSILEELMDRLEGQLGPLLYNLPDEVYNLETKKRESIEYPTVLSNQEQTFYRILRLNRGLDSIIRRLAI